MSNKVAARFYVTEIKKTVSDYIGITLLPVTRNIAKADEYKSNNSDWSKYTPSGKIELNVSTATGAAQWFEDHLGKDVAITFEDVPE